MSKVKIIIKQTKCRCNYFKEGEVFMIDDKCAPICHELWHAMYPFIYVLLNNGLLDYGDQKTTKSTIRCPDNGRVVAEISKVEDD